MIILKNIKKKYQENVINDISFTFKDRGLYVILGDSGCGKSTLLNIIGGAIDNYLGDVLIDDVNLKLLNNKEKSWFRLNNIGFFFQDFLVLNLLNVYDNVYFNLDAISSLSKDSKNKLSLEAIKHVHLEDKKKVAINKLSGGEKQRVAIARAIATNPRYLLCDEPTGNLDENNADDIFKILKEYSHNHLTIVVTHDKEKAKEYADEVIYLKDGKIVDNKIVNDIDNANISKIKIPKKSSSSFSLSLMLKTGFSKIKEKKFRSLFTNFLSSLSLLAVGVGLIITSSLKNQIVSSFSSVIDKNQIIVTKKSNNPNPYTSYIASSEESVNELAKDYDDYLYGVGASYLNNFNSFFVDRDQVYIASSSKKIILSTFHAINFANNVWKEEKDIKKFYPRFERSLALDEVILGLTYQDMVNLCLALQIERSFEALGAYFQTNETIIALGVDNLSWGYENDSFFHLVSVYVSNQEEVYHTNHFFNVHLFENEMQLPTTNDIEGEPLFPWTLKKTYTLHTLEVPTSLIESVQFNKKYNDIILERADNFLSSECIIHDNCASNVVYVFTIDKNSIDIADIIEFKKITTEINDYYFSTNNGYQMHPSGFLTGFICDIGFSFDEEKIIEVGDYFSKQYEGMMEEMPGVALGGLARFNNNGVLFSSNLNNIKEGNKPNNYNEIVVSTGLLSYLKVSLDAIDKELFYCIYSTSLDAVIINSFKIVGIIDNDKNYIYHNPQFTISFFRDKLGISSLNLVPTNIVIDLNSNANFNLIIDKLANAFPRYLFSSPLEEISKTVDEVMNYVSSIALAFSLMSLFISVLLLFLIAYLNVLESKNDINLLKHLGHSKLSIYKYMCSHSLVIGLFSSFVAIFELLILQFVLALFLSNYFGSSLIASFNIGIYLLVFIIGLILPIFISFLMTFLVDKKKEKS